MSETKLQQSIVREVVDKESGEITLMETTKVFTQRVQTDEFYMVFVNYISPMYNLTSSVAKSLLT